MQSQENWLDNSIEPFQKFEQAHSNSIECLQFNPSNQSELATGSHDKLIKIWDVTKQKESAKFSGHKEGIWSISYSLDGKQIFSGSPDKSILVWDAKSGKTVQALKEHKNRIYWIQASDNGLYLASGGQDGHLILWDLRKLKLIKDLQISMDIVYNINFSQQSKYFFTGDSMGVIKAYDSQKIEEIQNTKATQKNKCYAIQSLKISEDNYKLFVASKNQSISEYNFDGKKKELTKINQSPVHCDSVHCLNFDKDKRRFGTGARDGAARVWQTERKGQFYNPLYNLIGHKQRVTAIEFHGTGKIIATCSWDQNIHLYKI
ncbi:unnamed protein product (macronuclear) [Paramecium tetraurelia]|uniref:Uncharacterized protein n=1 Tax=Paramecium tetraurelia TaxID=5888 RepID=A0DGC8_PARTE|nr:uncharacterized protein GSPATT00002224001 [Paramecium tetraurelia]CAK82095.1 unnamed protein product [Paramecium tetraurelia]|eukprot:XP_001449492.1 hypothetical protein (macronuclear) [Paramecium tetraurelia strain d4-2]